ncbi:tRNA lysidine(34) synthetase TilS [Lentilactobacillus otakiensis]|uniref:tRNA lysidine(34) synthetase TilS n=1 Tax=Lentilactobacillus otakiensis TaxID=481720 RepID=UPI0031DC3F0B
MNLQAQFNLIIKHANWWTATDQVVVAVSTGVDSMTLLHLLLHLPADSRPKIIVAYVDHQLRDQSDVETSYINDYCASHQLQLEQTVWPLASHPKTGIEAAARAFRYAFFQSVLHRTGANYLLTAHHGDDLVETVIMKLVRGGQLSSLTGIQAERPFAGGTMIRPLLSFSKQQLQAFAETHQIKWYEDATNHELTVQRNRVRHEMIPLLKAENPRLLPHVLSYTTQLADTLNALNRLLDPIVAKAVNSTSEQVAQIDNRILIHYPENIVKLVIQRVIEHHLHVPNVSNEQLSSITRLVSQSDRPQAKLDLEDGWQVQRQYELLIICKDPQKFLGKSEKRSAFMVILDRWYSLDQPINFGVFSENPFQHNGKVAMLYLSAEDFPLQVRSIAPGDRLPIGQGKHQKVNRVLINAKIPDSQRELTQVLVTANNTVLSVLGIKNAVVPQMKRHRKPYYLVESKQK